MDLIRRITEAVDSYWAEDVEIIGVWSDELDAACIVYRRTTDPNVILGCRVKFHPEAADGTLDGFARSVALDLAEPIGAQVHESRKDQYGILWVAIPREFPTPSLPADVIDRLGLSNNR